MDWLTRNCRNPTLSYTQRLEERIKDLEDQLANITKSPPSAAPSTRSSPSVFSHAAHDTPAQNRSQTVDEQSITRSFRGLKIDDNGAITYHGATSFFHLPSDRATAAAVASDLHTHIPTGDADCLRRERLVSNAWQQRALENLSEIPVCVLSCGEVLRPRPSSSAQSSSMSAYRNRSNTSSMSIGAGFNLFSISSTARHSLVRSFSPMLFVTFQSSVNTSNSLCFDALYPHRSL